LQPGARMLQPGARMLQPGARMLQPGARMLQPGAACCSLVLHVAAWCLVDTGTGMQPRAFSPLDMS
jgi:hypothetical protein